MDQENQQRLHYFQKHLFDALSYLPAESRGGYPPAPDGRAQVEPLSAAPHMQAALMVLDMESQDAARDIYCKSLLGKDRLFAMKKRCNVAQLQEKVD